MITLCSLIGDIERHPVRTEVVIDTEDWLRLRLETMQAGTSFRSVSHQPPNFVLRNCAVRPASIDGRVLATELEYALYVELL